jgi:hypothetical protein
MEPPESVRREFAALPPNFYGNIDVTFMNGEVVTVRVTAIKKINPSNQRSDRDAKFAR